MAIKAFQTGFGGALQVDLPTYPRYQRAINFIPAYDRTAEGYGIHGMEISFYLLDNGNGLSFTIMTNWHLEHVRKSLEPQYRSPSMWQPTGAFVGLHLKAPRPGHNDTIGTSECKITGGACYGDGSSLLARDFLETLIAEGEEALWKRMETTYEEWTK